MSDPQRLLSDTSLDPAGRLLLESWQQDGPPADGRARTLAALGIVSVRQPSELRASDRLRRRRWHHCHCSSGLVLLLS